MNLRNIRNNRVFKYIVDDVIVDVKKTFGVDLTISEVRRCCDIKNQTLDPTMFKEKKSALTYMKQIQKEFGLKITDEPKYAGRNYGDDHVEPSIQLFEKKSGESWTVPYRLSNCMFGEEDFAVVITIEAYSHFIADRYDTSLKNLLF